MNKTNLSIEFHQSMYGNYRVVGKVTGRVYSSGSKFDCTWQIKNNPEWRDEEIQEFEERERENKAMKEMQEAEDRDYLENYDPKA